MSSGGPNGAGKSSGRRIVYCLVPRALARRIHEPLRDHFADDASVEVIVEHRDGERRSGKDRRTGPSVGSEPDRRRIRNIGGRRIGERRAASLDVAPLELPRRARAYASQLVFLQRIEPSPQDVEDLDSARLVSRFQAGDEEVVAEIYLRYFDRVYTYMRAVAEDAAQAEDLTQQVFINVLRALDRFEYRGTPFRAWLFTIARNAARTQLRDRFEFAMDPHQLTRELDEDPAHDEPDSSDQLSALDWITDRELQIFVERLPAAQRQVLMLRFMMGFTSSQIAEVLGVSHEVVRKQQSRGLAFLRARLQAVGRTPRRHDRTGGRRLVRRPPVVRARRYALLGMPVR